MSARPHRTFRFRRRVHPLALWLALAAAFLPTLFPSLHAGHGFPIASAPDVQLVNHSADLHHAHHADQASRADGSDERHGAPAAPDHRPTNGVCPICRTLQQIGAAVVPEIAIIVERDIVGGESVAPPVVHVSTPAPYDPTQPRAPPVDA